MTAQRLSSNALKVIAIIAMTVDPLLWGLMLLLLSRPHGTYRPTGQNLLV